ncbi:radical SAM protein [Hyphomicrobium sp. B1]|uniref:radical SAM protein n=1 Tax=Hyphomicrobium sp. B1 TaxID=3075651 RepID=UPI003C2DE7BE
MVDVVRDCQINVYNFRRLLTEEPAAQYGVLRFDPNNTCNLHCVYCHNHRSDQVIDTDEFSTFLQTKILGTSGFQVGCIMEPTLDKRMADFMLLVANSPAKPTNEFILQTNGILLHRHDPKKMNDAGLTRLSVSMDAADPEIQKSLRGGMSLEKVLRNVEGFIKNCPEVAIDFITTVTSANIDKLDTLVTLGCGLGIRRFIFRELFYYPDNNVVDHSRMPGLMLKRGQFMQMAELMKVRFGDKAQLIFAANEELDASAKTMSENSKFTGRQALAAQSHQAD